MTTSQLTDLGSTVYDVASFFYEPATAFLQTSYSGSPTARRYYQNNEGKLFYVGTQVSIGVLTIRLANQPRQSPSVILPSNWVFDFNAAWVTVSPDGKLYVMGHNAKYSTNGGSTWTTHTTYRFSPPRSVKVSGLPSGGWVQSARITLSVINQPSGYSLRYRVGQGDWTVTTSNPAQITVTTSGTLEYEVYSDSSPVFSGTAMISWVDSLPPDPPENVSAGGIETECRSDVDQYPITWQPPSTIRLPLTHYEVFDGTGLYSVSVPEITVNGLSYGVHSIRVRSVNPNGVSSWSEVQICRALSGKVFDATGVRTETMSLGNGQALSLTVSPKAVQYQPTLFMVYPATNPTLPSGKIAVVSPLHLEARRQSDGEIVSLFDEPILVSFTYNEADLQGINPRQLSVYYHDPLGEWVKIPSIVDVNERTVSAYLSHFSEYAVFGENLATVFNNTNADLSVLGLLPLSLQADAVDFGSHPLTGYTQSLESAPAEWLAVDPTGLGEGWHITVLSTDFMTPDSRVIPSQNLLLRIRVDNIQKVYGNQPPHTLVTDWVSLSSTALQVLSADAGAGMGTYRILPDFRLIIPAGAYAGKYTAYLTVTIATSP